MADNSNWSEWMEHAEWDQCSYIQTARRVYGKTIKQIARETGHSSGLSALLRKWLANYAAPGLPSAYLPK